MEADTKRALETLQEVAASASVARVGITILSGKPSEALPEYALRDGYQLLVVGRRGRGSEYGDPRKHGRAARECLISFLIS